MFNYNKSCDYFLLDTRDLAEIVFENNLPKLHYFILCHNISGMELALMETHEIGKIFPQNWSSEVEEELKKIKEKIGIQVNFFPQFRKINVQLFYYRGYESI